MPTPREPVVEALAKPVSMRLVKAFGAACEASRDRHRRFERERHQEPEPPDPDR